MWREGGREEERRKEGREGGKDWERLEEKELRNQDFSSQAYLFIFFPSLFSCAALGHVNTPTGTATRESGGKGSGRGGESVCTATALGMRGSGRTTSERVQGT